MSYTYIRHTEIATVILNPDFTNFSRSSFNLYRLYTLLKNIIICNKHWSFLRYLSSVTCNLFCLSFKFGIWEITSVWHIKLVDLNPVVSYNWKILKEFSFLSPVLPEWTNTKRTDKFIKHFSMKCQFTYI